MEEEEEDNENTLKLPGQWNNTKRGKRENGLRQMVETWTRGCPSTCV